MMIRAKVGFCGMKLTLKRVRVDRRRTSTHSRAACPIGTIRPRHKHGAKPCRMIKVKENAPPQERWMEFARWWWLRNRGPIPPGKRVAHADGDTMNDDPSNLVLMTPGEIVKAAHARDLEMSRSNHASAARGTAEANRRRGKEFRATSWARWQWYAVDFRARVIVNQPRRKRWMVLRDHGVAGDGSEYVAMQARALGFARRSFSGAIVLSVLARGPRTFASLFAGVNDLRMLWGYSPIRAGGLRQALSSLGDNVTRQGRRRSTFYGISPAARAGRTRTCRFIPVRGQTLLTDPTFQAFRRVDPAQTVSIESYSEEAA